MAAVSCKPGCLPFGCNGRFRPGVAGSHGASEESKQYNGDGCTTESMAVFFFSSQCLSVTQSSFHIMSSEEWQQKVPAACDVYFPGQTAVTPSQRKRKNIRSMKVAESRPPVTESDGILGRGPGSFRESRAGCRRKASEVMMTGRSRILSRQVASIRSCPAAADT